MNQLISVYELINLYLNHNSDQKTSPEYTQKLKNQYKATFFLPAVNTPMKSLKTKFWILTIDTKEHFQLYFNFQSYPC